MVFYGYPMVGSAKRAINGAERSRLRNRQAFAPRNKNNKKSTSVCTFFQKNLQISFFFCTFVPAFDCALFVNVRTYKEQKQTKH